MQASSFLTLLFAKPGNTSSFHMHNQRFLSCHPFFKATLWSAIIRNPYDKAHPRPQDYLYLLWPGLAILCSLRVGKSFLDKNGVTTFTNTDFKVKPIFKLFDPWFGFRITLPLQTQIKRLTFLLLDFFSQEANLTLKVTLHTWSGAATRRWVRILNNKKYNSFPGTQVRHSWRNTLAKS